MYRLFSISFFYHVFMIFQKVSTTEVIDLTSIFATVEKRPRYSDVCLICSLIKKIFVESMLHKV